MDLSGPHVDGRGFGMPSFGADYKYFLAGVYQPPPNTGEAGETKSAAWPYVELLYTKSAVEVLKAIQKIVAMIDSTHVAKAVFRIHSDRGGEFVNALLEAWAADKGILLTTTEGHDPAGNGQAESYIGKVKQRARAMISMCDLGTDFWTFAVKHAARCSRAQAQEKKLPEVPVFGKKAYARVKDPGSDDFAPRAVKVVFLGLDDRIADGKIVMYENGYVDVNAVVHEVMMEVGVEQLPGIFAPIGPQPEPPVFEEPAAAPKEKEADDKNNFDDTGALSQWLCPACRGKHRSHTMVPGQCKKARPEAAAGVPAVIPLAGPTEARGSAEEFRGKPPEPTAPKETISKEEGTAQQVNQKREYAEVAKTGMQQDIQKELAEVLRSLNNKLSGVTEMKDKELDELLVEKLARSKHKRETITAMRAEAEAICGAVREGEAEKDEHLERAEK